MHFESLFIPHLALFIIGNSDVESIHNLEHDDQDDHSKTSGKSISKSIIEYIFKNGEAQY